MTEVLTDGLTSRREAIRAGIAALTGFWDALPDAIDDELGDLLGDLGLLASLSSAGGVAVTALAGSRGVIEASQYASATAWVADHAVSLQAGGASAMAKCAGIVRRTDLPGVPEAVESADLGPAAAVSVATEFDRMAPVIHEGAAPWVLEALIEAGATRGPRGVAQIREALLAEFAPPDALQENHDARRQYLSLSAGTPWGELVKYQLVLDVEGSAVLEAGIGPLSAPRHDDEGVPDPRPFERRRAEALIDLCRRAAAAGSGPPGTTKTQLYVTMSLSDLVAGSGVGTTVGSVDGGSLLAPEAVRRLACDAGLIPLVLGSDGQVLDLGRTHRLFSAGQVKALWWRDRHCTFPGCDAPAHWCEAHHLVHWADGGPTDLGNGALLCGRHHTIAHRDRLAGSVVDGQVLWDRWRNSYRRPSRPPRDPDSDSDLDPPPDPSADAPPEPPVGPSPQPAKAPTMAL